MQENRPSRVRAVMRVTMVIVWILTALVVIVGISSWAFTTSPGGVSDALAGIGGYIDARVGILAVGVAVTCAIALFIASRWLLGRIGPEVVVVEPHTTAEVEPEAGKLLYRALRKLAGELEDILEREEVDAIDLVDRLLAGGIELGVSDIHLQPQYDTTNVAFRVHGSVEPVLKLPSKRHHLVINRLKVLANVVTYVSDRPQDGHFATCAAGGDPVDVRLSLVPTNHGEKAVLRIAPAASELPVLDTLGISEISHTCLDRALSHAQGLVFITGPTGSGKTTTIYACLGQIASSRGKTTQICTIEDPIEFDLPNLTQTQVNASAGFDFAAGLRSVLRQDPDILMVGEIRDMETAAIAIQAGLTGHLILTTVHAESAAGVFNRMIDMGVEPFLVASASLVSVSQRLVRKLCPNCAQKVVPTDHERTRLHQLGHYVPEETYAAMGCDACDGQGFIGRTPVLEVLELTGAIRDAITSKVPTQRIHEEAIAGGMQPLITDGLDRARDGLTTLGEVLRVTT